MFANLGLTKQQSFELSRRFQNPGDLHRYMTCHLVSNRQPIDIHLIHIYLCFRA